MRRSNHLIDFLQDKSAGDPVVTDVVTSSISKNDEYKREKGLSSRELNDMSMQMFRVKAIAVMVKAATEAFVGSIDGMMLGRIQSGFELIAHSRCAALCSATKSFDRRYGFGHKDVLQLELKGNNAIKGLMSILWRAINNGDDRDQPFTPTTVGNIS